MEIISREQAEKEVVSWLDYKKVSDKKRASLAGNIASLTLNIMDGVLTLNPDTFVFTQELKFPIGTITKLEYQPRVEMQAFQDRLQNVKSTDSLGTSFAYIAALTNQPSSIIKKMDQEDYSIADHLSVFFMM